MFNFFLRLVPSLPVRVCLTRRNTQPFLEPSPVTISRLLLLQNSWNILVGVGLALFSLTQTMVTMGWRPFYEQRRKRVYVWNTLNQSLDMIHRTRFNRWLKWFAGSYMNYSDYVQFIKYNVNIKTKITCRHIMFIKP